MIKPSFRISEVIADPQDPEKMRCFLRDYHHEYAMHVREARELAREAAHSDASDPVVQYAMAAESLAGRLTGGWLAPPGRGVYHLGLLPPTAAAGEESLSTTSTSNTPTRTATDTIDLVRSLPFIGVHVACLAVVWTGVSTTALVLGFLTLALRMFGLTAGYHRYFCHKAFRTTRVFQFVLAWLGTAAAQKGPLWWAGHHRSHHRHSDTEEDVHPPGVKGFFWAHAGWIMSPKNQRTRVEWVPDLVKYPELVWLDRNHYVAPVTLGVALYFFGEWIAIAYPALGTTGWQLVVVALFCSTTVLYHATFAVNSIGHTLGTRRYATDDESRNSLWLALVTGGEGWHNNHHRYSASERQGFYWWEIDFTHYGVVLLSWLRIVWDVRGPAPAVLHEGTHS